MVFVILLMWLKFFRKFNTKEITKTGCSDIGRHGNGMPWQIETKSHLIQVYIFVKIEKFKCYIIRIMLYCYFELTLVDIKSRYSRTIYKILFNLFKIESTNENALLCKV